MDGKEALTRARDFYDGPIIVLSARDRETEKIAALDLGADDDVERPFGVGELLARLRVAIRHKLKRDGGEPVVAVGTLVIDLDRRRIYLAGQPVRLTPREYDLLAVLVAGGGKVITHRALLAAVWGPDHTDVEHLRVVVGQLRAKLEGDASAPKLITTEHGVGYRFNA